MNNTKLVCLLYSFFLLLDEISCPFGPEKCVRTLLASTVWSLETYNLSWYTDDVNPELFCSPRRGGGIVLNVQSHQILHFIFESINLKQYRYFLQDR